MIHEVTVVSDVICPWCFIAKRNLDKALKLIGNEPDLRIIWRPFELNPDMPPEGLNRREYRTRKFGSWEYSQKLDAQTVAAGELAGVGFRYDLMKRTPNTFEAHRLIWLAERDGIQDAVVEALFRGYFIEGRDIGDRVELGTIAREVGLQEVSGNSGFEEVRAQEKLAIASGVSGVPTFFVDGAELFSGALKPDAMAARLHQAVVADAGK
jgi:predicted DsbA family dithiol-disulfide isomerase